MLYLCLCACFVIGIGALSLNVNKYPLNLIDIKKHDMVSAYGTNGKCIKVKFTLEQATKAQRGCRGIALLFP